MEHHSPQPFTGQPWLHSPALVLGQDGLLFGNGKWFLHLDGATVSNGDILQGLVLSVRLGLLHLPHHILGDTHSEDGMSL